ncbi:MAG: hypothetical protein MI924_19490 [Chloroflexales bacterium]|nr:hypothetical protein [Chloroflexales bacterium]
MPPQPPKGGTTLAERQLPTAGKVIPAVDNVSTGKVLERDLRGDKCPHDEEWQNGIRSALGGEAVKIVADAVQCIQPT